MSISHCAEAFGLQICVDCWVFRRCWTYSCISTKDCILDGFDPSLGLNPCYFFRTTRRMIDTSSINLFNWLLLWRIYNLSFILISMGFASEFIIFSNSPYNWSTSSFSLEGQSDPSSLAFVHSLIKEIVLPH